MAATLWGVELKLVRGHSTGKGLAAVGPSLEAGGGGGLVEDDSATDEDLSAAGGGEAGAGRASKGDWGGGRSTSMLLSEARTGAEQRQARSPLLSRRAERAAASDKGKPRSPRFVQAAPPGLFSSRSRRRRPGEKSKGARRAGATRARVQDPTCAT